MLTGWLALLLLLSLLLTWGHSVLFVGVSSWRQQGLTWPRPWRWSVSPRCLATARSYSSCFCCCTSSCCSVTLWWFISSVRSELFTGPCLPSWHHFCWTLSQSAHWFILNFCQICCCPAPAWCRCPGLCVCARVSLLPLLVELASCYCRPWPLTATCPSATRCTTLCW